MRCSPLDSSDANAFIAKETSVPFAACPSGIAMRQEKTLCFGITELGQIGSDFVARMLTAGVRTPCCFPLISRSNPICALCIARKKEKAFAPEAIEALTQGVPQVAGGLDTTPH